jgi:hypothetical protein
MKQDPSPVSVNYTNMPGGYTASSSRSAEQVPSYPIPPVIPDAGTVKNLWINSFIRSVNWKPKTSGFTIDGKSGYAEFTNVFVSGRIDGSIITGSSFSTTGPNGYSVTINNDEDAIVFKYGTTVVAGMYSFFLDAGGNGDEGGVTMVTQSLNAGAYFDMKEVLNGVGPLAPTVGQGIITFGVVDPTALDQVDCELSFQDISTTGTPVSVPFFTVTSDKAALIDFSDNRLLIPPKIARGDLGAGVFPQTPLSDYDNGSIYFDTAASKLRIILNGVWHWVLTTPDTDFFRSKTETTTIGETLTVVRT